MRTLGINLALWRERQSSASESSLLWCTLGRWLQPQMMILYSSTVSSVQLVSACVSMMEVSSFFFKAPGKGGGVCVYKDAVDKQKVGRDEEL